MIKMLKCYKGKRSVPRLGADKIRGSVCDPYLSGSSALAMQTAEASREQ
jgi:hypothetical protein